jgi:adenylate cyclase
MGHDQVPDANESQMPVLTVVDTGSRTSQVELSTLCRLGRSDENDVVLDDDATSRNHAIVYSTESGEYYINDLASSNGTFVNRKRVVAPTLLNDGDRILIGKRELVFHDSSRRSPKVARELGVTGLLILRKLITVLVVDIRGFTRLAQAVPPDRLSQITGTLFRESGRELQERGAEAQKYIGDAVMAVWNHNDSVDATGLLNMFEALAGIVDITSGLQSQFGLSEPLRLGAALNTGFASVGNMGSAAASDYTALGETVNKAFRLESATREAGCDLLVGPETHFVTATHLPVLAPIFEVCQVNLKGYDEPATAFATSFAKLKPAITAARSATPNDSA